MEINKKSLFIALILLGAIIFQVLPYLNMYQNGILNYPLHLSEVKQGGAELIGLFIIFIFVAGVLRNTTTFCIAVLSASALYLGAHHALAAAGVAVLYFEIIILFGNRMLSLLKLNTQKSSIRKALDSFVAGLVFWLFFALLLSIFDLGGFNQLRILTIVLGIVGLTGGIKPPLSFVVLRSLAKNNMLVRLGGLFLLCMLLAQLAKGSVNIDYDSMMYGLRPEYVLFGLNSFFDNQGLTLFVHYYPKAFELFIAPLSNLGVFGFIYAGNVYLLGLLYVAIYSLTRLLKVSKEEGVLITVLIGSLPAAANMASTAKTDIFTSFLIVMTCYYFWVGLKERNGYAFFFALSTAMLSLGGKLTSFLYIPLLFIGLVIAIPIFKKTSSSVRNNPLLQSREKLWSHLLLTVVSLFVFAGITARTFLLTGYPVYPVFSSLWQMMGFKLHYPLGNPIMNITEKPTIGEIINNWYHLLLDPGVYSKYIGNWPGNMFAYLIIVLVLAKLFGYLATKRLKLALVLLPTLLGMLYYATFLTQGSDGNYYLPPVILLTVAFIYPLLRLKSIPKQIVCGALLIFIPLQSITMVVAHPSWHAGTGAPDYRFSQPLAVPAHEVRKNVMKESGLWDLEQYLESKQGKRVLGFGPEGVMHFLSARFEYIPHIAMAQSNNNICENSETFLSYLHWSGIDYLIQPKTGFEGYEAVKQSIDILTANPNVEIISFENYILIDISNYTQAGKTEL